MTDLKDDLKKQIFSDRAISVSFVVTTALLVLFTAYSYTVSYAPGSFNTHRYVELNDLWLQILPDGRKKPIASLPVNLGDRQGEEIVISRRLPLEFPDEGPVLFLRSNHQDVAVRIGGKEVYRYQFESSNRYDADFPPTQWLIIPLGDDCRGARIEISLTRRQNDRLDTVSRIYLGDKADIIFSLLRRGAFPLLCGAVPLLIGVAFLLRQLFTPMRQKLGYRNLCVGCILVLLPMWMVCNSEVRQLFFANIPYVRNMEFLALLLLPIPIILSVNYSEEERFGDVARGLCAAIFLCDVFIMLRTIFFGRNLLGQMWLILLTIAVAAAFIIGTFIKIGLSDAKLFSSLLIPMLSYGALALAGVCEYVDMIFFSERYAGVSLSVGIVLYAVGVTAEQLRSQRLVTSQAQQAEMENRAKSEFLASMSHEIRTPINAIIGMNEMILRESTEPEVVNYAADIQQAGKHLLSLINDVLDLARIESGRMDIVESDYDLPALLSDIADLIQVQANDKGLAFDVTFQTSLPDKLHGDAARIRQIAVNLLSNAVKYTRRGRVVFLADTVSAEQAGVLRSVAVVRGRVPEFESPVYLRLTVRDTGIGIHHDDIALLFDRFTRLDRVQNAGIQGTGLGLSIVSTLVELMRGCLIVESVYGVGSQFSVVLPQQAAAGGEQARPNARNANGKALFRAPEAEILAVDDNALNRRLLQALLRRTQVRLTLCPSGKECLELVRKKRYDLILMDHLMPEMDGIETLRAMQAMEGNQSADAPVLVLTANAIAGVRDTYIAAGFRDYLSKPLQSAELEEMIRRYLPPEKLLDAPDGAEDGLSPPLALPRWLYETEEIDTERGLKFCATPETYLDTLTVYAKNVPAFADEIEGFYRAGDVANVAVKVHALKSTSRAVGAEALGALAEKLELAGKAGDAQTLDAELPLLLARYRALGKRLSPLLDAAAPEGGALRPISDEELRRTYDMIGKLVEEFEHERANVMIEYLLTCRLPDGERQRAERLRHAAENFDWDRIGDILR